MTTSNQLQIIDRDTTLGLMDFDGLIASQEQAFVAFAQGEASPPAYINLPIDDSFAHYKAGYRRGGKHFVLKFSGGFWGNEELGLPVDNGFVMVHSSKTGEPQIMFLDQGEITNYRTAAAGALTCKLLAKQTSKTVGVIGTGAQARLQVEALRHVRPNIDTVRVWGRRQESVARYIADMQTRTPQLAIQPFDQPEDVVRDVDILITATPTRTPFVKAEWISPGTHIVAVGAAAPHIQEYEPEALVKANKLYVDSLEQCARDGELHHALEAGVITQNSVTGTIGDLVLGKISGRGNDQEITFVDLVGLGIQDALAVEHLLTKL